MRLVYAYPELRVVASAWRSARFAVIERLWRAPSSAADVVLAVLGEVHPSKVVAKAARKALVKRRSSSPGR